jgi:steroid delta-isomerase-like uncharacterized protein
MVVFFPKDSNRKRRIYRMAEKMGYTILRRFIEEGLNRGNLDVVDELIAPNFVEHEELPPGSPEGREGVRHYLRTMRQAFPDLHGTVGDEVVQGDKVVVRSTWQGTHAGHFLGIPPTGKRVSFDVIDIVRLQDGKVVEHWGLTDGLGLLQQLGVVAVPGQTET